jgi:hypothetical protein
MVHLKLPESISGVLIEIKRHSRGVGLHRYRHTTCKLSYFLLHLTHPFKTSKAVTKEYQHIWHVVEGKHHIFYSGASQKPDRKH